MSKFTWIAGQGPLVEKLAEAGWTWEDVKKLMENEKLAKEILAVVRLGGLANVSIRKKSRLEM